MLAEAPGALVLSGLIDTDAAARLWRPVLRAAAASRGQPWVLDVSAATAGTAGAALLAAALSRHGSAQVAGASPALEGLIALARRPPPPASAPRAGTLGGLARSLGGQVASAVAFLGESVVAAFSIAAYRRQLRAGDLLQLADQAGVRALPLVLLLGYLMGLILAFQSAIPLRRFGADLFVVNLVGLSLLRELGPLLAAVILAGRTGSAFAAELGTMKVNEELAALQTMGVSPMRMLVLPRLAAAVAVMPVLTLFLQLAGLAGMLTVMMAFGFAPSAVAVQLGRAIRARDLWGGLFKAVCFGAAVAGIGCRAGLATGIGAQAVGRAATAAVVGGIVVTIVLDGVFAVIYYRLGV